MIIFLLIIIFIINVLQLLQLRVLIENYKKENIKNVFDFTNNLFKGGNE